MPHNLPLTILGAALLWFGWFGFNAGSALAANGLAASAFVTTHLAAAAAALSWILVEWLHRGKPTTLGMTPAGRVRDVFYVRGAGGRVEDPEQMAEIKAALNHRLTAGDPCAGR